MPSSAYEGFEAETYLFANPDVKAAVEAGTFISALHHYISFGRFEGRPTSVSGMSFNFTGRIDTLVGTQGNDTFTSDPNTLQRGDSLKAAAGVDTLMVTLSSAQGRITNFVPITISDFTDVENLSISSENHTSNDFSTITSLQHVTLMSGKTKGLCLEYVYQLFYMKKKQIHLLLKKVSGFLNTKRV